MFIYEVTDVHNAKHNQDWLSLEQWGEVSERTMEIEIISSFPWRISMHKNDVEKKGLNEVLEQKMVRTFYKFFELFVTLCSW